MTSTTAGAEVAGCSALPVHILGKVDEGHKLVVELWHFLYTDTDIQVITSHCTYLQLQVVMNAHTIVHIYNYK